MCPKHWRIPLVSDLVSVPMELHIANAPHNYETELGGARTRCWLDVSDTRYLFMKKRLPNLYERNRRFLENGSVVEFHHN